MLSETRAFERKTFRYDSAAIDCTIITGQTSEKRSSFNNFIIKKNKLIFLSTLAVD